MPSRRHYRIVVWAIGIILAGIIGFQLAYPFDRGLPLASVAGQSVRLSSHDEMAKVVTEKFNQTRVKVTVDNVKSVEFDLKSAGAEPNTEVMIGRLSAYPLWQRFIPGSILWQPAQVIVADVYYANEPFKGFITEKTKELNF
ncbi:MAG TPA: hypothetical protein VFT59_00005, partial [Candidatus Saccharimonadales bacterium]|nr:hypothetical protein [Candidatus Saccharimonadales bacterium]